PFITKQDIRRNFPHNFLGPEGDLEALVESESVELEHTSGTSEERTPLLLPRGWWGEQERRALELNALVAEVFCEERAARRVTISSPVCSSEICYTGVPSRDERTIGNTLFLSLSRLPFLWSEAELARLAEEALEWKPRFLDVDPVYGAVFARYCERQGIRLPSLSFVLCSYEYVSLTHRRILERVFGVPVFDLYGSTETGHLLMEDAAGCMRPSLDTAVLEILEPDNDGVGELVVTTLTNDLMPLIRYRIGDLVTRVEEPYRTRYILHGRAADAFHTRHGRRITTRHVDQCFSGIGGVLHYQVLQRPGERFCLRFVPDGDGPSAQDLTTLQDRLSAVLAPVSELQLEPTELLMPENSGKFRLGYPVG
ncbi:MAG TPA: hypothetical protein VHI52_05395, partial [Verrucomicrobiae bacterium]|nr:hypothetical protein [Verrucomicrobiae bacterium]